MLLKKAHELAIGDRIRYLGEPYLVVGLARQQAVRGSEHRWHGALVHLTLRDEHGCRVLLPVAPDLGFSLVPQED